jgi:hypothetical protein
MQKQLNALNKKENYKIYYRNKYRIFHCPELKADEAYTVLKHFYGAGFATWFVEQMNQAANCSASIA